MNKIPHLRGLIWAAIAFLLVAILSLPPGCNDGEFPSQRRTDELVRLQAKVASLTDDLASRDRIIEQLRTQLASAPSSWASLTSLALVGVLAFIVGVAVGAQGLRAYRIQHKEPTRASADCPPPTS